jgi:uncharacterized protein DUF6916
VNISRAAFLKAFGCAGVGTLLDIAGPRGAAAVIADPDRGGAPPMAGGNLAVSAASAAHFRPHVGEWFTVRAAANEWRRLALVEVVERPVTRGVEQFSLIFHGAPAPRLAGGTHVFSHPRLGAFDLFIAPIGPANRPRSVYQACFSRFATASRQQRA